MCLSSQPSPLSVTNDTKIVRDIESVVDERANCARDMRERHPKSTEERLIASRTEMWEVLRVFDACVPQLTIPAVYKLPQGDLGRGGACKVKEIGQPVHRSANVEPLAPASVIVRFPHLLRRLLTASSM